MTLPEESRLYLNEPLGVTVVYGGERMTPDPVKAEAISDILRNSVPIMTPLTSSHMEDLYQLDICRSGDIEPVTIWVMADSIQWMQNVAPLTQQQASSLI